MTDNRSLSTLHLPKSVKKYEMIAEMIESMLLESDFGVGDRLPSVKRLCGLFEVATATMCNSLELLRDRGVIESRPRSGNFVKCLPECAGEFDVDTAGFLEGDSPVSSIFTPRPKRIKALIDECRFPNCRRLWDEIVTAFHVREGGVAVELTTNPDPATDIDVVLGGHRHWPGAISESAEAVEALFEGVEAGDYFPAAWVNPHKNRDFAMLPFAVSQQARLWNVDLVKRFCPELSDGFHKHVIRHIVANHDYQAPDFPIVASFVHFLPLVLMEEGVDVYDPATRATRFDDPRIPEILTFNKRMFEKMERGGDVNVERLWRAFADGEIMALDTFSYALSVIPENPPFAVKIQTSDLEDPERSISVPQTLGVGVHCQDVATAVAFIQFACGPVGQRILAQSRAKIPARRVAARDERFISRCPDGLSSMLDYLERPCSVLIDYEIFDERKHEDLQDAVSDYLKGARGLSETMKLLKGIKP